MKYYGSEFVIDKRYAGELQRKLDVFAKATKTKKAIFLAMVTTYGVQNNSYAKQLVNNSVSMDDLFAED